MNQSSPNKNFWIYNGCWSYSSILSRGMQWLFDSIIHKSRGGCGEKTPRKPEEHYHKTGCAQKIARSYWFEHGTMPLGLQHFLNQKIFATKAAKSPMVRFSVRCLFFFWVATIFFFSASGFGKNDDAIVMQQLHFVCFAEVISWESKDGIPLMPRFLGPKIRRGHKGRQLISWQKT